VPDASQGKTAKRNELVETVELIRAYVQQETVDPLKGAARWMGFGLAGAVALGLGVFLLMLGLLRLLQTEAASTFDGNWSWAPYAITLAVAALIGAIAASRIRKQTLQRKEPRR
jgi:hypothetical protein